MTGLYLTLLITSLTMMAVLSMVFFDTQLRSVLSARLYNRTFTLLTIVAIAGIFSATTLAFTSPPNNAAQTLALRTFTNR